MKKKSLILIILLLVSVLLVVAGCQTDGNESHTYLPLRTSQPTTTEEAPDDVLPTPGGSAYRANIHEQGVKNPWQPIETTVTQLGSSPDTIDVRYRNIIVTKAGETRNNILYLNKVVGSFESGGITSIRLYSIGTLSGLKLLQDSGGGLIGQIVSVLVIEIAPDVKPGEYPLEIGLDINGKDYGTIPCTIKVVEGIPEVIRYGDHGINSTKIELMPGENVTISSGLMVKFTLVDLVEKSDAIIIGKVIDIYPSRFGTETPWSSYLTIFTDVIIETERYLYGEQHSAYIAVRVTGGRVDDTVVWVEDEPVFNLGEEAILFLTRITQPSFPPEGIVSHNYYRVTGVSQGKLGYAGTDENSLPGVFVSVATIEEKIAEVYDSN